MAADEGLIQLLNEVSPSLPARPTPTVPSNSAIQKSVLPADLPERLAALDWQDDTVGQKWDKIRSTFLNAKSPEDLFLDGSAMSTREWLEWAVKMAPKQADPPSVQITAIRIELPSRNALDQLGAGDVIEVEVPAQS